MCDKRCCEKSFRFSHIAATVGKEDTGRRRSKKNQKEHKVSGNRNLPSKFSEQVKTKADTDGNAQKKRRACDALKSGNGESFKEELRDKGELCEWTFERIEEAYDKVAMGDIGRLCVA